MSQQVGSAVGSARARTSLTIAAVTLIMVGVLLGLFARGDQVLWGDVRMLQWAQSLDFAGLREFVAVMNAVGGAIGGVIIAVGLVGVGFLTGRRDYAALVAIILCLRLIGEVLKPIRRKPSTEFHIYSLPR